MTKHKLLHAFHLNSPKLEESLEQYDEEERKSYSLNLQHSMQKLTDSLKEKGYTFFIGMATYRGLPETLIVMREVNGNFPHIKDDFYKEASRLNLPYRSSEFYSER